MISLRRNFLTIANTIKISHSPLLKRRKFADLARPYLKADDELKELRCSIFFGIEDTPGALEKALNFFRINKVNMTRINSQWKKTENVVSFSVDMNVDPAHKQVKNLLRDLKDNTLFAELTGSREVPWFPVTEWDVDELATGVLEGGHTLEVDHPGFKDKEYRERRASIADSAYRYTLGDKIQTVDYTLTETECWGLI